ncbi:hypothetical protein [Chryseobacterium sp. JJR-5R]
MFSEGDVPDYSYQVMDGEVKLIITTMKGKKLSGHF